MIPSDLGDKCSHMYLEQYHLLTGGFELNTQKTVVFRLNLGNRVYIYDKDKKVLYFQESSYNAVTDKTSIQDVTLKKHINEGTLFLDTFAITDYLIPDAQKADLNLVQFNSLLDDKRVLNKKTAGLKGSRSKPVRLQSVRTKDEINFDSISNAVLYLKKKYRTANKGMLRKNLDTAKVYKDHYCTSIQPAESKDIV